jgi:hypothetical protein
MTRARRECSNLIGLLRQSADIRDPGPCRDGVDGLVHSLQAADRDELVYLRSHSPWKFLEGDPTPLITCDRLSFDPDYPTPYLEEMVPYLERFYGLA